MARHEVDREDLIVEATALFERVELRLPGSLEPIVAGFRRTGHCSLYFGSDPVYHFTSGGALRRAFVDGNLYCSQGVTLSRLQRKRTEREVQLQRRDLTADELNRFLSAVADRVADLLSVLQEGEIEVVRQVPPEADILTRLRNVLHLAQQMARQMQLSPALRK